MNSYQYQDGLESDRLITRFITIEDVNAWTTFFKDKEAIEFFPIFEGSELQRSEKWIERQLNRYHENRYGLQVLIDKKSKEIVGQSGLLLQDVDGIEELEVGYHIYKRYWGNGFAPEAAKLFINYAFKNNLNDSVISIIHKNNFKSQKVANKNKLELNTKTNWLEMDVFIYRIKKTYWKPTYNK